MKTVVTVPTYNEAENIAKLIETIRGLDDDIEVLVADDNSPDGTWKIVEEIGQSDPKVHILRRMEDRGRGLAGANAFQVAMDMGADQIVEMDADFSHDPKYIPALLEALGEADVALGSRGVKGGGESGRSFIRTLITKLANYYIRLVLWISVRDCNSGFRAFRRKVFEVIPPGTIKAKGPDIVQELLFTCHKKGLTIKEVPIHFVDREAGTSKITMKVLLKGLSTVLRLRWLSMTGKLF